MATRSISIELSAKVQGFVAGMKTAEQSAKDFSNRTAAFAREHEQSLDRVGKAGMLMGGGLLAGVGVAVKSFMDFDKAMSSVKASTHETAANMDMLRQAAIDAGADTAFSAAEAANAIDEMAKAGVSTKDILSGGLKGALSLAAAGSMDVGDAAELAATAMTQFKLAGTDLPHVSDLLAAGAGKAQGSVSDMGMALKQSGLVANMFGLSIEETTGSLAAFASQGLIGSDAGTSFKQSLLMLANPSKEASATLSELGIATHDANGKFVGMASLAGQLKEKMGPLTDAQRQQAMATIFGSDAIRVANALYDEGAQGITDWTNKVNDAGFAAETAAMKQDNLAGDFEKLTGSIDSVFIKSADGANGALRGLVQGAEDFVDSVGKIPEPALNAGLGLAGITGGMLLVGGAFTSTLPKIMEGVEAFGKLEKASPRVAGALKGGGLVAGLFAVAGVLGAIDTAITDSQIERSVGRTTSALIELSKQAGNIQQCSILLDDLFQKKDGSPLITGVQDLDSAMTRMFKKDWQQSFSDWGESMLKPVANMMGIKGASQQLEDSFKTIDDQLASFVQSGHADIAAKAFKELEERAAMKGIDSEEFKAKFGAYSEALKQADADARVAAEGMGQITTVTGQVVPITPEVAKALEDIGLSAQGAVVDLVKFADAMLNTGLTQLSARDAARNFQAAIDAVGASITANGTTLDINTEKGRANQAALDGIASAGFQVVKANAANGASQSTLQGNLTETYNRLVHGATQFGITGQAAINLAREIMHIPPGVDVKSWMSDAAKRMAQETAGAINAIPPVKNVQVNTTYNETTIQRVIREISGGDAPVGAGTVLAPKKKAVGGAIIGPGTGTSDDILALLSNGEHVLTAEEVQKMGGQAAVYRMRALAKAGLLPKFAAGGPVTWGQVSAAEWKRLMAQGWRGRPGDSVERLYPPAAKAPLTADQRKRQSEQATARREFWIDYQRDSRRGNGYRTVSTSLSSAYSFADKLTSLADSGNVSAASVRRLYDAAGRGEAGLRTLHGRADKLSASLDKAKSKVNELAQVRDRIKDNLAGGFNIIDAVKQGNMYGTASMKDVTSGASSYLSRVQSFAGKLKALQKKGYSGAIVQEIAELGLTEGSKAADVLLKATAGEVKQLNKTKTDIDTAAGKAGTYVTDSMYKGGISAAQAVVKGIESQQGAIGRAMLQVGLGMENALRAALGQKPIKRAGGGAVSGPGTGTSDEVPAWLSNGEHVLTAAEVQAMGGQGGVYQFRRDLARGYRYQPGYAPRVNTPAQQPTGAIPAQQFGDVHITQQSDPVATYHEFSRRTRRLSV